LKKHNNGDSGVSGRNIDFKESDTNSLWKVAKELKLIEKLTSYKKNIALQGEIVGESIQGNPLRMTSSPP